MYVYKYIYAYIYIYKVYRYMNTYSALKISN